LQIDCNFLLANSNQKSIALESEWCGFATKSWFEITRPVSAFPPNEKDTSDDRYKMLLHPGCFYFGALLLEFASTNSWAGADKFHVRV
jgi:hypothetical protein